MGSIGSRGCFVNACTLGYTCDMKLVYSGGFDKRTGESEQASVLYAYQSGVRAFLGAGKHVAFVGFAKSNGYYAERLHTAYGESVTVLDEQNMGEAAWSAYDCIFFARRRHAEAAPSSANVRVRAWKPETRSHSYWR